MSDLRTAAQQALEALEFLSLDFFMLDPVSPGREAGNKAITALRAALAEPEHEIIQRMRRLRAESQAEHQQAIAQGKCPSCMQPLPEELKTEYAMQKLTDVQQEMERSIKAALPKELKLEEQVNRDLPVGCKRCANPLWCGIKCKSCGKDWTWTKEQT